MSLAWDNEHWSLATKHLFRHKFDPDGCTFCHGIVKQIEIEENGQVEHEYPKKQPFNYRIFLLFLTAAASWGCVSLLILWIVKLLKG